MAYAFQTPSLGFPLVTDLQEVADATVPFGTIATAVDPTYGSGEFIFMKGAASVARGSWVIYNTDDGTVSRLAPNAIGDVAVAMAAITASYAGWFHLSGKAVAAEAGGIASNASVWIASTGVVDDTLVSGDRVQRAKTASGGDTPSSGLAEFEIARPFVNNATD